MKALGEKWAGGGHKASEPKPMTAKGTCPRCGARRIDRQVGLEETPEGYVAGLVEIFSEARRVLRKDGTLWINIGDSYAGSRGGGGGQDGTKNTRSRRRDRAMIPRSDFKHDGIKAKDLVGIPWRLAFALQADGWYLRQDIIWAKPNPMPESVRDRCTKAHEYIFLLSRSPRYYFDAKAIQEPAQEREDARRIGRRDSGDHGQGGRLYKPPTGWDTGPGHHNVVDHNAGTSEDRLARSKAKNLKLDHQARARRLVLNVKKKREAEGCHNRAFGSTRNRRSVWTVATRPYLGAHFATFPPALVEPMILAGCPPGGIVLDPFFGHGTAGLVALRLGRDFIGIELSQGNCWAAEERIYGRLMTGTKERP